MSTDERPALSVHDEVMGAWRTALPGADPGLGFFDQGGTSLKAIGLIVEIEKRLGVAIPFEHLVGDDGAEGIIRFIRAHRGEEA